MEDEQFRVISCESFTLSTARIRALCLGVSEGQLGQLNLDFNWSRLKTREMKFRARMMSSSEVGRISRNLCVIILTSIASAIGFHQLRWELQGEKLEGKLRNICEWRDLTSDDDFFFFLFFFFFCNLG